MLLILYWGVGFRNDLTEFLKIYVALLLIAHNAIGMGLIISAAANNVTTATSLGPIMTMPNVLFGGLLANSKTMHSYISWAQWLSPVRYANEAIN